MSRNELMSVMSKYLSWFSVAIVPLIAVFVKSASKIQRHDKTLYDDNGDVRFLTKQDYEIRHTQVISAIQSSESNLKESIKDLKDNVKMLIETHIDHKGGR
jgi:hypothetical protein